MPSSNPPPSSAHSASVSLHFPCEFRYLAVIRETALEVCSRVGMSEFDCYQVEMAVDEAVTNIIEHSYGGEAPPTTEQGKRGYIVVFMEHEDGVVIDIFDHGKGFDFDNHPIADPQEYLAQGNERGLGMFIISQFVDEIDYQRGTEQGNRLRLTKRV
jgi:anti-sigma regulatory factor (Ser/Thr protein kinase)